MELPDFTDRLIVPPGKKISLSKDYDPGYHGESLTKKTAKPLLEESIKELAEYQSMLYAQDVYGLLVILQARDAAGKDGAIKHVMSGINPQGVQVFSFKQPSAEELDHDYMWRSFIRLPERGRIGIFNRSYYEEVLVVRVHPSILENQRLPPDSLQPPKLWHQRMEDMNHFERYMTNNGYRIVKIFLNISKAEQRQRFLDRIDEPDKNWKFSMGDVRERGYWDEYQMAYEDMLNTTSTEWAPWYVVPADHKWFSRLAVAGLLINAMRGLDLHYPEASDEQQAGLEEARQALLNEAD
jgi:PPK2 family polyphosphate:nucleotide phosphotransferase